MLLIASHFGSDWQLIIHRGADLQLPATLKVAGTSQMRITTQCANSETVGQSARERGDYQGAESFFKQSLELEARLSLLNERLFVEEEAQLSPDP